MPDGATTDFWAGDDFSTIAHVNHDSPDFIKSRIIFLNPPGSRRLAVAA
jgi:hypothetical protein